MRAGRQARSGLRCCGGTTHSRGSCRSSRRRPGTGWFTRSAPAHEWRDAVAAGVYRGSAVDVRDGFIHLSTETQLAATLRRHFVGQYDLVLVGLDPRELGDALRWESSRGGDLFPHLYGDLEPSLARALSPVAAAPAHAETSSLAGSRDYSSISPSARALLLVKALTTLPYALDAARLLFGEDAVEAARREAIGSPGAERRLRHFEVRARSIDAALATLGATRVLEIASGLSMRGLAMAERANMHYLDTDLPAIAAVKADLVPRLHPGPLTGELRVEALDALDARAFATAVGEVPPGSLAVVQEGLLVYLDPDEKARLAASIRQALLSRGGAWVTGDVYVRSPPGVEPYRDPRTQVFVERHEIDQKNFASFEAAEAFFVEQGFAVARRASTAADDPWGVRETWMLLPIP
jgi:uncharacterized protein (DUF952 family)/O-methyltransferase involved in polyketide biosynthesis